jgi:hypothetical protein
MNKPYEWAAVPAQAAKPEKKPWAAVPPRLIASASVFGVLFAYLLVNQEPGLNFTLLVMAVYAFAFINRGLFVQRTFRQEWPMYIATIPVIFLSILFFTSDTALNVLSVPVILLVMAAQYVVISGNAVYSWDHPGFFLDLLFGALNRGLMAMGLYSTGLFGALSRGRSQKKAGVLTGVAAGVVLLLIVVPLLLLSEPSISGALQLFLRFLDFGDIFLYLFVFYLGASLITAPIASAKSPGLTGQRKAGERAESRPIPAVTPIIALTMLGIVYVLFAAVQFRYFFLPYETLQTKLGLTSSEYAVRGFGELLVVTCINFAVILAAQRFTALKDGKTPPYLKALLTLLVAFNFVIMASSHLRMQVYEMSFGHTVLRFLSHSFMVLLLVLNAIVLLRIFMPRVKIAKLFMAAALLYFCTATAIGPERYVARRNIGRYEQAAAMGVEQDIDMGYLLSLSDSAMPAVCDFAERHPELMTENLRSMAANRLDSLRSRNGGWQSLNTAQLGARQALEKLLRA